MTFDLRRATSLCLRIHKEGLDMSRVTDAPA